MATKLGTRSARLVVRDDRVEVFAPKNIDGDELRTLNSVIVDKVIFDLTGCACLSGAIDVIFHRQFENTLNVDLATGQF